MTAADLLVEELQARGVSYVASLNGHGLDPFYLACRRAGMRIVDVRNEQAASYMAEVTGRLTRSVGVCAVSGAVAHANGLTGVLNAALDGAPMLLITGITSHARLGYGDFQDFNPVPMAEPICKYAKLIDVPEQIGQIAHEAFVSATSGRPGPVHLSLPMDVALTEVDPATTPRMDVRSGEVRATGAASTRLIDNAVQLIARAKRPVLVAGSGVYYSRAEQALVEFAEQQKIPTVVPIWDRGSIAAPSETFMGVIGAASGGAKLLPEADLVIMAGAQFDYRVGQLSPPIVNENASVIRIDSDEGNLRHGLETGISIHGSPREVLQQLAEGCRSAECPQSTEWLAEAARRRKEYRDHCLASADSLPPGTNGRDVVQSIFEVATDDALLMVDGGNIGQWFHQMLPDRYPGHWVTCGASGVVGWGLPGAMAARALYPDRPVILLSGDGSFTFTVAELECASRQRLPFVAVVADDQQWGISVTGHVRDHGEPLYSTLGPTRLDKVAEGLGCRGLIVEDKTELPNAIRAALTEEVPTVIQVPIAPSFPGR